MDNINKYTPTEVLNKVLRDENGDSVAIQHYTNQEAFNAVLDEASNRLNVLLEEVGDLTITGDLTVDGDVSVHVDTTVVGDLDIDGSVGIGTDSPANNLHVKGSANGDGLTIQRNSTTSGAFADLKFSVSTSDASVPNAKIRATRGSSYQDTDISIITDSTERMRIDSSGNVGIGTDSPASALHINQTYPQVRLQSTDDNTYTNIGSGSGYMVWDIINPLTNTYQWRSGGSTQMSIDTSGNVGIGTTSPTTKLQIDSANHFLRFNETDGTADKSMYGWVAVEDELRLTARNDLGVLVRDLVIYEHDGNILLAPTDGNVGIGTLSPNVNLQVVSSDNTQIQIKSSDGDKVPILSLNNTDMNYHLRCDGFNGDKFIIRDESNSANRLAIDTTGNVGIGTINPTAPLEVNGVITSKGGSELTIASGEITITHNFHPVDTESDASTDDLETINGGIDGQILVLRAADNDRTIVLKDNTDNLRLAGDFSMDSGNDIITLICSGGTIWFEISRSDNA